LKHRAASLLNYDTVIVLDNGLVIVILVVVVVVVVVFVAA